MEDRDNIFLATTLAESFVLMHEMFDSLLKAGFTEDQALKYLAYVTGAPGRDA